MKKPQLFLMHFAGGNCYSFQFMTPYLRDFDVIPLELPGRGKRIREDLLTGFPAAAEEMYRQVCERLTSNEFLIYGHSMGAYLALKVTNMLENSNRFPACVIVSGNAGPGAGEVKNRYRLPHDEFIDELRHLGGAPPEVLENEELLEFFMPILRADFEVAELHGLADEPPMNAPLFALMGSEEEKWEMIGNWRRFTRSDFNSTILKGGHFFINDHPQKIAEIISEQYRRAVVRKFKDRNVKFPV